MNILIKGVNDFATTHLDLVKEWDFEKNIIKPTEISAGSNKKVFWKCREGHSWQSRVANRTHLNRGCPYCAGQRVIIGQTDLATTHPDLIKEWDYNKNIIKPTEISKGSNKKVFWLCEHGHSYQSYVNNRVRGVGCPYCSGRYAIKNVSDLTTTNPSLVKEWDFEKNAIKPTEISIGSHIKVWWKCNNGHSYCASIHNRVNGRDCPYCKGKKVVVGKTDLTTLYPNLVKEWDFSKNTIQPTEVTVGSNKKVFWKCEKGHSFEQRIDKRTKCGQSCPYCKGKAVLQGFNDLATAYPDLVKEWDCNKNTLKPTEVTSSSGRKVWWICNKGHNWQAIIANRTKQHQGCPLCRINSKSEILVCDILAELNIEYIKEWKQTVGIIERRYDFYLSELQLAVEIDGKQHFEEGKLYFDEEIGYQYRVIADSQKNIHLFNLGIPLLRIPGLDTFNKRLQSINQSQLSDIQYKQILVEVITYFITTRKIHQAILDIYKCDSDSNYYKIALQMNEMEEIKNANQS